MQVWNNANSRLGGLITVGNDIHTLCLNLPTSREEQLNGPSSSS